MSMDTNKLWRLPTPSRRTLEMVRSGEFPIRTYGNSHCGTASAFKIRYHLKCVCSPKLDHRGFLFDQLNIQSYFESIQRTHLSCERLTEVCLQQLLEHILVENPSCQIYSMQLTLSPEPYLASMTSTLEDPGNLLAPKVSKRKSQPVAQESIRMVGSKKHDPKHHHKPSHSHYRFRDLPE